MNQMEQKFQKDAAQVDMDEKELDYNKGYLSRIKEQKANIMRELEEKNSGVTPVKTSKRILPKQSNTKNRVIETTPTKEQLNQM